MIRSVVRRAVVMIGVIASLVLAPAGVGHAAIAPAIGGSIASVLPKPGETVGVAHPIVITFTGPVTDRAAAERALDITSSPAMTGRYEWLDANVVQWKPDDFWPAHSTVALSVGGRPTQLTTGPKVVGVASIAEHTFTVSVDGAPPTSLPAPHHRPYFGQQGVFPATMGRPAYPTPVGIYTVLAKERSVVMDSSTVGIPVDSPDGYHLTVDYAVRFTSRGLFVHSAPWAVNSMGNDNVSHGCISISPEDAEWYYNNVNIGDPIIVRENSLEVPSAPKMGRAS